MTQIPTDPLGLAIWLINLGLLGVSFTEGVQRLQTGLSAQAEKEGRELTEEELALIKGLLAEAERRRKGGVV